MEHPHDESQHLLWRESLHPAMARFFRRADAIAQIVGVASAAIAHGLRPGGQPPHEVEAVTVLCMAVITAGISFRYRWSLIRRTFLRTRLPTIAAAGVWLLGILSILVLGPLLPTSDRYGPHRWEAIVKFSEVVVLAYAVFGTVHGLRRLAAGRTNPALRLVGSFALLVTIGTLLLMLPTCRAPLENGRYEGAPFLTALFTATSASCVTGLTVEPTRHILEPHGPRRHPVSVPDRRTGHHDLRSLLRHTRWPTASP